MSLAVSRSAPFGRLGWDCLDHVQENLADPLHGKPFQTAVPRRLTQSVCFLRTGEQTLDGLRQLVHITRWHQAAAAVEHGRQVRYLAGNDRFAGGVSLGEPDGGLQVPLWVLGLPQNLDPGSAVGVLQDFPTIEALLRRAAAES